MFEKLCLELGIECLYSSIFGGCVAICLDHSEAVALYELARDMGLSPRLTSEKTCFVSE